MWLEPWPAVQPGTGVMPEAACCRFPLKTVLDVTK